LQAFREEIQRCQQLNISWLNFHPGAFTSASEQECLDRIVRSLLEMKPVLEASSASPMLLLEATAGQGSSVGYRFEHLAYILDRVKATLQVGICIDTCHIFVAGYDLRTQEACQETFKAFDSIVGLSHLKAFHMNDSLKGLGSRVDRHASLGKGMIGLECFKYLMTDPHMRAIPKFLETPEGPPVWKEEIKLLREFAAS